MTDLSLFRGFIINLPSAQKTKNVSLMNISWVVRALCACPFSDGSVVDADGSPPEPGISDLETCQIDIS